MISHHFAFTEKEPVGIDISEPIQNFYKDIQAYIISSVQNIDIAERWIPIASANLEGVKPSRSII
jgi:hypothetical protein